MPNVNVNEEAVPIGILIILCVIFAFRIGYILVDLFRNRLSSRYKILRFLPNSLIVKIPVRSKNMVYDTVKPMERIDVPEPVDW